MKIKGWGIGGGEGLKIIIIKWQRLFKTSWVCGGGSKEEMEVGVGWEGRQQKVCKRNEKVLAGEQQLAGGKKKSLFTAHCKVAAAAICSQRRAWTQL